MRAIFYFVVRVFAVLVSLLPVSAAVLIGRIGGRIAYALQKKYVRRAEEQLSRSITELSTREVAETVRRMYEHIGLCVVEFLRMDELTPGDFCAMASEENRKKIEDVMAAGRGAIVITGHVGMWEVTGQVFASLGWKPLSIAKPMENERLDRWINRRRRRLGHAIVSQSGALKASLRAIRNGRPIGVVMDQDGKTTGMFVPFFGRPASTVDTAARLAIRTGCPILPVTAFRKEDLRTHVLRIGDPVEVERTGETEHDVAVTLARCNAALEQAIREHPEQWLWFHRRWGTKSYELQVTSCS